MIWGNLSNTKLSYLQTLQNRECKLIQFAKCKDGWVCDWLDVRSMTRYDKRVITHEMVNGQCPEKLKNRLHTDLKSLTIKLETLTNFRLQDLALNSQKRASALVPRGVGITCQELSEELVISLSLKST